MEKKELIGYRANPIAYEFAKKLEGLSYYEAREILKETQSLIELGFRLLPGEVFIEESVESNI